MLYNLYSNYSYIVAIAESFKVWEIGGLHAKLLKVAQTRRVWGHAPRKFLHFHVLKMKAIFMTSS